MTFARGRRDRHRDRPRADRPGHPARRPRRAAVQHAPGVDLRGLRDLDRPARVVVPIYPTNSPEECEWVAGNSESVAIVCEDAVAGREDRRGPRATSPPCATSSSSTPRAAGDVGDAITLDDLRERGRGRDARRADRAHRRRRPGRPVHLHLHVGHDRAAEGLRPHARQLPRGPRHGPASATCSRTRTTSSTSSCPLAHAFALLIQLASFDIGTPIAYFGGDTKQIIPELIGGQADLPAVGAAHLREALHAGHRARRPGADREGDRRSAARSRTSRPRPAGPARAAGALRPGRRAACSRTCAPRSAGACARPSPAPRRSPRRSSSSSGRCGVPVLEGYGMTETVDGRHDLDARGAQVRHGRQGAARRRDQDRRRRRDPHQGREHLQRLLQERRRVVRRGRGRLAAHRRPRVARRGGLPLDHRPQEGHHHHRGRQEPHAGELRERPASRRRWVSQAIMHGDRRPYPVDARHARRGGDRPLGRGAGPRRPTIAALAERAEGPRAHPGRARQGQREVRAGRAGQEVRDPRPRPLAGDRRADADAEGQAQRRQREVRRPASTSCTAS